MDWFIFTFMKSLIDKMQGKSDMYISEKQADICAKYMQPTSTGDAYFVIIGEYQYTMRYMKKGYGKLSKLDKRIAVR